MLANEVQRGGEHRSVLADPVTATDTALTQAAAAGLLLLLDVGLATLARTSLLLQYAVGVASWWLLALIAVTSVLLAVRALQLGERVEPILRRGPQVVHHNAVQAERLAVAVLGGWCLFLLVSG
jgi:hypothetical protein